MKKSIVKKTESAKKTTALKTKENKTNKSQAKNSLVKVLVIIPTYNEKDNIKKIIKAVLSQAKNIDVLVVDDNSPDKTADIVQEMIKINKMKRIHILKRKAKEGLGPAYIAGFKEAFRMGYDFIIEMDADFSHDPEMLPRFLNRMENENIDLLIGSRYCGNGISIINWPLKRLILSYYANVYARVVLSSKIKDITGGFKCFRASILKKMKLENVLSKGYSFQIEMNNAFEKNGYKVEEESIVFSERRDGKSKMSGNIILEAFLEVIKFRLKNQKKYFT